MARKKKSKGPLDYGPDDVKVWLAGNSLTVRDAAATLQCATNTVTRMSDGRIPVRRHYAMAMKLVDLHPELIIRA
tara:strand:- start:306 stop:530 length:225 start_codon:yes stop_codon:yes gene_type:complete